MNVDQLDELIRKYLSTGVAVVLVLVGPAAAPSGTAARPQTAATSAHSTGATTTNSRAPSRPNTGEPTAGSYDTPSGRSENADSRTAKPTSEAVPAERPGKSRSESRADDITAQPTAEPDPTRKPTADEPADPTADPTKPTTDPTTEPTTEPTGPTEPYDPADKGRSRGDTPDTRSADDGPTAAATHGWGTPNRADDFTDDLSGWGLYDGPGHANKGTRSPGAAKVTDGVLTIDGDADGTTAGMAWDRGKGQKYGRWEGRVRAPASDPTYNALLLLWPDAEDFPRGGEIDFMEMTDHTRQATNVFLHHGKDNAQEHGIVKIDATQWHNWAVEWTPKGVTTYVDGKQWWHTDNTAALPPGPMHLCVQLDWFPQKGGDAVKPSQMQVDWVRQYPLDAPSSDKSVMRDLVTRTFGW